MAQAPVPSTTPSVGERASAVVLWFTLRRRAGRSTWFVPLVMAAPPLLFFVGASIAAGVP